MKKMLFNCVMILISAMFTIFFASFKILGCYDLATYSTTISSLMYLSIVGMAAAFILCLNDLHESKTN